MKNSLLTVGGLLAGLVLFTGTLTVAGAALRQPVTDIVFSVTTGQAEKETIEFPFSIAETELTVERLMVYEGPNIEENSDEPLVNALAMLVHNTGGEEIRTVQVVLKAADATYRFYGSHIPADGSVLLVEENHASWSDEVYTDCTATVVCSLEGGLAAEEVAVEEKGMGEVAITNLTEHPLKDVWVFHKNLPEGTSVYIGGITYQTKVGELQPQQTVCICPERYAAGYSRIVRIEGKTA